MGYLYVLMGKSSTGKDSIYGELFQREIGLKKAVIYTTRPKRDEETDGVEYHFVTKEEHDRWEREGKLIESRCFHTVLGDWYYFSVDDGKIDLQNHSYLVINTLEGFVRTRDYYGTDKVIPIYVEVPDGERLLRAVKRENSQTKPNYEELCRRFLADSKDFSEKNLKKCGINEENRFVNEDLQKCIEEVGQYILRMNHRK